MQFDHLVMGMADDKNARDKQARDADRRQREREILTALERQDETEPPVEGDTLDEIAEPLEEVDYPATGADLVTTVGTRAIESPEGTYTIQDLVPETDVEVYASSEAVRVRLQRPTIAAAMKRIVEATDEVRDVDLESSQREAYEKTLRKLKAIDADDEDEGIRAITDWIVEEIRDENALPGSRDVRREAAAFCRANGYEIQNDEWLGV